MVNNESWFNNIMETPSLRDTQLKRGGSTRHSQKSTPVNTQRPRVNHIVTGTGGNSIHLRSSGRPTNAKTATSRRPTGLFVSRLASNTKPVHLEKHVQSETGFKVKCEQLSAKHSSYTSFHLLASPCDHRGLLNPNIWPKGVIVRPYYE